MKPLKNLFQKIVSIWPNKFNKASDNLMKPSSIDFIDIFETQLVKVKTDQ